MRRPNTPAAPSSTTCTSTTSMTVPDTMARARSPWRPSMRCTLTVWWISRVIVSRPWSIAMIGLLSALR
ncbi:hypothetical protein EMPG_13941 [Blastomyces silverae]|uniref:Uncharacterized protein n=1 Tax=Blastomyces silverae TaxID=2060906 RepID=A0A0H1BHZ7_9EURO|nr:hypothetical protein EMPG_13941 [Blastomyces silverae]